MKNPVIELPGSDLFRLQVVGESNYQHALEKICGGRTSEGVDEILDAKLELEDTNPYDRNAVKVTILGLHVGYLSRTDAAAYRAWLLARGYGGVIGTCQANIRGGWQRKRAADRGDFGVWLDFDLYD